ncbi:hypothetical protein C0033_16310 [Clostridium sp. chh4-2]|uniref:hypothetical protein n=1 Tax=Clostridium sp. chh4-2 TaxID=2067550 RepID=UPI000CCE10E9|nr:hypothetical protein [Clostridium sp. chh4-2]PNV61005.1 hypothetical protein C0033_16310 [Clostridium sp. chh4-2]
MIDEKRIEALKQKLLEAAGKYSDHREYETRLENLEELYDETTEIYDYDVWMGRSHGNIADKATEMLRITVNIFRELEEAAEQELYLVTLEIAGLDEDSQKEIWGMVLDKEKITEDWFSDRLIDWEYEYSQDEALEEFLQLMKEEDSED